MANMEIACLFFQKQVFRQKSGILSVLFSGVYFGGRVMNKFGWGIFSLGITMSRKAASGFNSEVIRAITAEFINDFTEVQTYEGVLVLRAPTSRRVLALEPATFYYTDQSENSPEERYAFLNETIKRLTKIIAGDEDLKVEIAFSGVLTYGENEVIPFSGVDLLIPEKRDISELGAKSGVGLTVKFVDGAFYNIFHLSPFETGDKLIQFNAILRQGQCLLKDIPELVKKAYYEQLKKAVKFITQNILG